MNDAELKLKVQGIDCPGCATDMEAVLRDMEGILTVSANYAEETLLIEYDRRSCGPEQIIHCIRRMGFKAKTL